MNAHTPCDCNYCKELNRRALVHDELVEALQGLIVHLEWRKDFIVEDSQENNNAYAIAVKTLSKARGE